LLLLHIYLDDIPIRHRAALFLEMYNSLISKRSEDYAALAGKELCELVYDGDNYKGYLKHIVDLGRLKQKERDNLDGVFRSWNTSTSTSTGSSNGEEDECDDVEVLRDYRLRGYYGERYDW